MIVVIHIRRMAPKWAVEVHSGPRTVWLGSQQRSKGVVQLVLRKRKGKVGRFCSVMGLVLTLIIRIGWRRGDGVDASEVGNCLSWLSVRVAPSL